MEAKIKKEVIDLIQKELETCFPKKDFFELKGNVETLTRHSTKDRLLVENNGVVLADVKQSLMNLEKYLLPHDLNNNRGLVKDFEDEKTKIINLQSKIALHSSFWVLLGTVVVGGGILSYFTNLIFPHS